MRCPNCGTENTDRAEWCNLCSHPFSRDPRAANGPDRKAPAALQPQAPSSIPGREIPQAAPSPGTAPGAPGLQQPAFERAPEEQTHRRIAILIGVVLGLIVIVVLGILILFVLWQAPEIKTPTPTGWVAAGETTVDYYADLSSENVDFHYIFSNDNTEDIITVGHGVKRSQDVPESESLEDVEAFFMQNRGEWEEYMQDIHDAANFDATLQKYEVVELAFSDCALHMSYSYFKDGIPYSKNSLAFYKDDYQFFVNITMEGGSRGQEELDFLIGSISFE